MNVKFIKEIRIYYECLEQAYHYVYPSIRNVVGDKIPIKLVKLRKRNNLYKVYAYLIADYLFWKDPDILISVVTFENEEIPIVAIEFSTAVFTEDHELQRFDGMVAAAERGIVFVKISPIEKQSDFEHGGKKDFDYKLPFSLVYEYSGIMPIHINWKSNGSVVEVDENYLSCPKDRKLFTELLRIIFNNLTPSGIDIKGYNSSLASNNYYSTWFYEVKNLLSQLSEDLLISLLMKRKSKSTSRINIDTKRKIITLKFNRFGHAMDPERGMLVFYSVAFRRFNYFIRSKMVFDESNDAWYKDIGKTNEIGNYIKSKGLRKSEDYLHILSMGLSITQFNKNILRYVVAKDDTQIKVDITNFILENWYKLNKPLRTIIRYSDEFTVEDVYGRVRVTLVWDKNKIFKQIIRQKSIEKFLRVTPLKPITEIDEDLVTYITIHNILRPQGYKILAASYPGAQGDRVILIEKLKGGRKQERRYVDIVSFSKSRNITTLQNNKGKFSASQINKDINELVKYKKNVSYKKGLELFFKRFEKDAITSTIKIGVGFWSHKEYNAKTLKKIKLDELDYFVLITSDMKRWKVFECRKGINLLDTYEGDVIVPKIFEPKS